MNTRGLHIAVLSLVVGFGALLGSAHADEKLPAVSSATLDALRQLPVQHNGRVKPFDSFAREVLQQVTGEAQWRGQDPTATVLGLLAWSDEWHEVPLVSVPFMPLREKIGLDRKAAHVSINELLASRALMKLLPPLMQKQQRGDKLTMLENETMDAYGRFVTLMRVFENDIALVPPVSPAESVWDSINKPVENGTRQQQLRQVWGDFILAVREGPAERSDAAFAALAAQLVGVNPTAWPAAWRMEWEVRYNRLDPFLVARWIYVLAALLLIAALAKPQAPFGRAGMGVFTFALLVHASGIAARVILGGRPPVSNFYETMLWLPFVAVFMALIFEKMYRVSHYALAASVLSAITLTLAAHVPLDPSIAPVVAVLRSNFWLTIHVLIIVASYGALGLAVVLAHVHAGAYLARPADAEGLAAHELRIYRTLQVGVVLLAAGIMLGAVWANASWGRYWGWDPKETWALITLLWYIALLHGRFIGWLRGVGVSLATIGGFFLLLMTYYGVSFYLVGLHSYAGGNAKPLPGLLVGYVVAEVIFVAVIASIALRRRTA